MKPDEAFEKHFPRWRESREGSYAMRGFKAALRYVMQEAEKRAHGRIVLSVELDDLREICGEGE